MTALRLKLRRLIEESKLPQGEFGEAVFGVDHTTICSYLAGGKIPRTRERQINRIEQVTTQDGAVVVISSYQHRQRWDFQLKHRAMGSGLDRRGGKRKFPRKFAGSRQQHHLETMARFYQTAAL